MSVAISRVLKSFRIPVVFLALFWMVGCVQIKPAPGYARAGDFIVIGLGGIERNSGGEAVLRASDLTIDITDANSTVHDLDAHYVFRSFPDYAAWMNTSNIDGSNGNIGLTQLKTFDGGWFAVIPLTVAGTVDSPLPLAVGAATITVSSPKLTNIADNAEGDLSDIPIEIIPGVSPHDADYERQFVGYEENGETFVIEPDDLTGIDEVGGAFLAIDYNDDSFFRVDTEPMAVPVAHDPFVQLNYNHVPNGNGTGTIYVTLLNSAGFTTDALATQNSSRLSNLTVKFIYFSAGLDTQAAEAKASFSIDAANSYYMGTDGSILAGVSPVLTHFQDL